MEDKKQKQLSILIAMNEGLDELLDELEIRVRNYKKLIHKIGEMIGENEKT